MPAALPVPLRQQILQRHQRGQSAPDIAWELGLPALTVRSLLRRLKDRGPAALAPSYRRAAPDPSPAVQQAIDCRRLHPSWGAQYIRTRLLRRQPDLPLPCTRTLLRHFARLGLTPAKAGRKPAGRYRRAEQPHQAWQMDAAEMVKLRSGRRVCWLRLVDECSGAFLQTRVFPPPAVGLRRGRRRAGGAARRLGALGAAR